ncbi:MAG: peptidylprolyl isomerase [Nitrospinae bacterium]|nr:peptidylprolyl isomerase [Nitrospinota bacterium]
MDDILTPNLTLITFKHVDPMKIRFSFIYSVLIFGFISSSVLPDAVSAQTRPTPKLKIEIPKLVARVNGVDIESKYIEFRLSQIARTVNRPLTVKEKTSIVKDLVEKEVVRELVNQQGKKENLKIDKELIEKELKALRANYASEEEFNNALQARNINIEDIKKSMQIDINARQLLNEQIKGEINISDKEVEKYYEENKSKFQRPEAYHTRHILAAYFPPEALRNQTLKELQKNKEYFARIAEEKIDKVIDELKKGTDFKELAKTQSDDESSRETGGDLDFIYRGVFDASFDEAAGKLNPGEISGKIKTRFGFHVIQLIEKKPAELATFDEMKPGIQKHLFLEEAKKQVETYVEKLKQTAKIETYFK